MSVIYDSHLKIGMKIGMEHHRVDARYIVKMWDICFFSAGNATLYSTLIDSCVLIFTNILILCKCSGEHC